MGKQKTLIEQIIEGDPVDILDNLPEPYMFLIGKGEHLHLLIRAINILATKKGYRVVNQSVTPVQSVYVLLEKKQQHW
jgi:precorrin-6B methylase 2